MSCFYVSVRFRVCSSCALSRLHALFRVGAWCSDPGIHVLSFDSCRGLDTRAPCSDLLRERAVSSLLGRALSCPHVLWCARSSCLARVHSCYVLCGMQLVYLIGCVLSCCHVLCEHVAYDYSHLLRVRVLFCPWLVICFAGHVLIFLFCVST